MDGFENLEEFNLSEDVIEKLKHPDTFRKELAEGKSIQEIFNFSHEKMVSFYQAAKILYEKQAYKEAAEAFFFLTNLDPYMPAYWMGLGMSEHLCHEYISALMAYGMAQLTDPTNPVPHYHAGACYKSLEDKRSALLSYECALKIAADKPEFTTLKEQIQAAIALLK